jgi:hypothetical protein
VVVVDSGAGVVLVVLGGEVEDVVVDEVVLDEVVLDVELLDVELLEVELDVVWAWAPGATVRRVIPQRSAAA